MLSNLTSSRLLMLSCITSLIGEIRKCGLDVWTVRWIDNWLNGRAQRVVTVFKLSSAVQNLVEGL